MISWSKAARTTAVALLSSTAQYENPVLFLLSSSSRQRRGSSSCSSSSPCVLTVSSSGSRKTLTTKTTTTTTTAGGRTGIASALDFQSSIHNSNDHNNRNTKTQANHGMDSLSISIESLTGLSTMVMSEEEEGKEEEEDKAAAAAAAGKEYQRQRRRIPNMDIDYTHLESIDSTQDEMKRRLQSPNFGSLPHDDDDDDPHHHHDDDHHHLLLPSSKQTSQTQKDDGAPKTPLPSSSLSSSSSSSTRKQRRTNPRGSTTKTRRRRILAISAQEQTQGRGTSGRRWVGLDGNLFLTVAFPMDRVPVHPVTLLPLQVGNLVASTLEQILDAADSGPSKSSCGMTVAVKWPNDVLLNGEKVAGILIESQIVQDGTPWLLVGIGINIHHAPIVPLEGPDRGRPATSLADAICNPSSSRAPRKPPPQEETSLKAEASQKPKSSSARLPMHTNVILGQALTLRLDEWLLHDDYDEDDQDVKTPSSESSFSAHSRRSKTDATLQEWKARADWKIPLLIRDTREQVQPLDLEPNGQLRVRGADGTERSLVAEYLF